MLKFLIEVLGMICDLLKYAINLVTKGVGLVFDSAVDFWLCDSNERETQFAFMIIASVIAFFSPFHWMITFVIAFTFISRVYSYAKEVQENGSVA
jgi:hypothetical protein